MLRISGVYHITCDVTKKVYVGSAIDVKKRWSEHKRALRHGNHHSLHFQRAWDKYGEGAFSWRLVREVPDPKDLTVVEQEHLDSVFLAGIQLNICPTAGSSLGRRHKQETRDKISASAMGNRRRLGATVSDATKAKLSASLSGRKRPGTGKPARGAANGMFNRKHSPESCAKISKALHGRRLSSAHVEKLRENGKKAFKGKRHSTEAKSKISEARRRQAPVSVETRTILSEKSTGEENAAARLTESSVREIRLRYAHGTCTLSELAQDFGVSVTTVHRVVKRTTWTHVS